MELSYEDVKSSTNGLIVITPDFDNFTAKLIAADKYSKYMTEIPILEGVTNREYYGRSATSVENKCKIEYGTEQGLAALIYGEKGLSAAIQFNFPLSNSLLSNSFLSSSFLKNSLLSNNPISTKICTP